MSNEQETKEKRLNAMKYKILKLEQENLKTREKNHGADGRSHSPNHHRRSQEKLLR